MVKRERIYKKRIFNTLASRSRPERVKRVKILQKKAVFNEITVDHFLKRKIAKKAASFAVFFSLHESK